MAGMVKDRLAAWALRHAYGDLVDAGTRGEGRLLWIDAEGRVRDLGAYAVKDLEALAWAVGVAYRCTPVRWEKTKLAGVRLVARRVAAGAAQIRSK